MESQHVKAIYIYMYVYVHNMNEHKGKILAPNMMKVAQSKS